MTRPTDHSLPGMGWALITTTSFSRSRKNRFSPAASRDSADMGSPWDPVEITHTWPGSRSSMSSTSTRASSGMCSRPSRRARATFFCIDRPSVATDRPPAMAASATCWTRWMWLAKQVTMKRRSGRARNTFRSVSPTVDSDGVNPGSSALVESASSSRIPGSVASAPIRARSVRRPSTGWRSILKSPEWRMMPCGVWKAVAKACGTEWVTGMNSTSHGPILPALAVAHRDELGPVGHAGLVHPVAGQGQGELGAVDGHREVAQQVGEAAGVVLVPVGEDDGVDPVGVLAEVGEVGQHQVDAGHVRIGEHDPDVEDEDPPVDLDAGAVPADLAQTAEEDDPHRSGPDEPSDSRATRLPGSLPVRLALGRLLVPSGPLPPGVPPLAGRVLLAGFGAVPLAAGPPWLPRTAGASPVPFGVRQPTGAPGSSGLNFEMTARAWSSRSPGAGGWGSRHWPTASPRARQAALAGTGLGYSSVDSNRYDSASCWLTVMARSTSPDR